MNQWLTSFQWQADSCFTQTDWILRKPGLPRQSAVRVFPRYPAIFELSWSAMAFSSAALIIASEKD